MLILTIRTDKPTAELGLYNDAKQLAYHAWEAHRQLAETIHVQLKQLLTDGGRDLPNLRGIVAYKGPGSFTGLRIGLSVANSLADALRIPIVAETGAGWLQTGLARLATGENDQLALPEYGALPNITLPKK